MRLEEPVLVVGAGIAGLVTALSLAKAGFAVDLCERSPLLTEAGAGLQLSPNALRVLKLLRLDTEIAARGVPAACVTLRQARSGRAIAEVPVRSADGTLYLSAHRADLQAVLLRAVEADPRIRLTLGMEALALLAESGSPQVRFRDSGSSTPVTRSAPLVVAADGVNSAVAAALGHAAAEPSGDIAWRMTVTGDDPSPTRGIEAWLGPSRHAVAYPIRGGRDTNLVLISREKSHDPSMLGTATSRQTEKSALLQDFAGWDKRLLALVEAAGPATAWPLSTCDRPKLDRSPPGIVLIGDAAHAMLPYAAQGAAMAIEDGWSIAVALRQASSIDEAIARHHAERRPRIEKVRARVAFHRFVYHLPWPLSLGRDEVLRLRSPSALARDLSWLYDWTPPPLAVQ